MCRVFFAFSLFVFGFSFRLNFVFAVQINGSIFKQKDCKKADSLVRKKNKGLFFQIKQKKNSLYSFMLHGFGASFFCCILRSIERKDRTEKSGANKNKVDALRRMCSFLCLNAHSKQYTHQPHNIRDRNCSNQHKEQQRSKSRKKTQILF